MMHRLPVPRGHPVLTVVALLFVTPLLEASLAGERAFPPQLQKPPDTGLERLDRPPREEKRASRQADRATLTQAVVITLAKATARKEVGRAFDDYELKAVIFEPHAREWSVLFERKPPRVGGRVCLYVYVDDETQETRFQPCS